jgi:hypothetical protein
MQHYGEKHRNIIQTEDFLKQQKMPGGADGEKFRKTLYQPQKDGFNNGQKLTPPFLVR